MPSQPYYLNLAPEKTSRGQKDYTRKELEEMTTFQLREICMKERVIQGILNPMDRGELTETILLYRGKDEGMLIQKWKEGGAERVQEVLEKKLGAMQASKGCLHNPAKIILYKGLDLTFYDGFEVGIQLEGTLSHNRVASGKIGESNVLLVGETSRLYGIFNLVQDGQEPPHYFLEKAKDLHTETTDRKKYHLLYFNKGDSDYLYQTYYDLPRPGATILNYYKEPLEDLEIRETEQTEAVLTIDLGTSGTTAGAFLRYGYISNPSEMDITKGRVKLNEMNMVEFLHGQGGGEETELVLPTVVGVSDCSDPKAIQYHFGREAIGDNRKKDADRQSSLFYGLKKWVNSYEIAQEVVDPKGDTAMTTRGSIIRHYLLYVIENAGHRFKCRFSRLNFTCPSKLKYCFYQMAKELLPEYGIKKEDILDEGTAVLYNTIGDFIRKKKYCDGQPVKALVLDCGGGTTDLSSCTFSIQDNGASYLVHSETAYENGDTDFGGDNLTYRLMQYIKVVFCNYYRGREERTQIHDLINVGAQDIFRFVDENGKEKVYEKLEAAYKEAEGTIPTRFHEYEAHTRKEYYMVKNNFYFLYGIADKMKQIFYNGTGTVRTRFGPLPVDGPEDLKITHIQRWDLVVREGDRLSYDHSFPDIIFNIKEIDLLLRADVYDLMDEMLGKAYGEGMLPGYDMIRLTGQSCKIGLFREALKEFIPGKRIEFRQGEKGGGDALPLKLSCVQGAIRFLDGKEDGYFLVEEKQHAHGIPYTVTSLTHEGKEKVLVHRLEKKIKSEYLLRSKEVQRLEFSLKDRKGNLKCRYLYQNQMDGYKAVTYEGLREQYEGYPDCILQGDTDTISDMETRFFVFPGIEDWGFYVVPVRRTGTQLYVGTQGYFPFEDEKWGTDLFDGMR